MENAGLVTFREVALLLDPATASLAQKKRVAEVVTHELAHQWFGNLVTMKWWDDLWLNEAFATWMAYKIVDGWRPEWRMWLDFDKGKAAALALDALASTHPVRAEVRTVAEATESFDLITYEKGGAVLRMIEGWLGEAPFREGIRLYMRRHAMGNAVADDLWGALGRGVEPAGGGAGQRLDPAARPPARARRARGAHAARLAAPLLLRPRPPRSADAARWPVPLVVRWGDAAGVHETRALLRLEERELELDGAGRDRVGHGERGLHRLLPGRLRRRPRSRPSPPTSRRSRPRSGLASSPTSGRSCARESARSAPLADLLLAFAGERDHAVLEEVVGRLALVEHRLVDEPGPPAAARPRGADLRPGAARRSAGMPAPGEDDAVRLRRAALVRAVGVVGREPATVAEAAARLDRFAGGERGALEANLHDAAVTMVARERRRLPLRAVRRARRA